MIFKHEVLFLSVTFICAVKAVDFLHQANAGVHDHDHGNFGYHDDGDYGGGHGGYHGDDGYGSGRPGYHQSDGYENDDHGSYDYDGDSQGFGGEYSRQGIHGSGSGRYSRTHRRYGHRTSHGDSYRDDYDSRHHDGGNGRYGYRRRSRQKSRNHEYKPNVKQLLFIKAPKFAYLLITCSNNDTTIQEVCKYGSGPFTVFAPTDYAFNKLPDDVQTALKECNETAIELLKNHIVSGFILSKEFKDGASFRSLSGNRIRISSNGYASIASGSKIVKKDLWAKNGVVQLVDCYLCYQFLDTSNTTEAQSIANDNNFQIFFDLFNGADLFDHSGHDHDFAHEYEDYGYHSGFGKGCTFLIPTDDAFNSLPTETQDFLMADENSDILEEIAKCHKIIGTLYEKSAHYGMVVKTKCGLKIWIGKNYHGTIEANGATLQTTDICTTNGVIHTIDRLIIPPDLYDELFMLPEAYGDPCGHLCEKYERRHYKRRTTTTTTTATVGGRTLTDTIPTAGPDLRTLIETIPTVPTTESTEITTASTISRTSTEAEVTSTTQKSYHHHHPIDPHRKELIKSLLRILLLRKGHIYDSLHNYNSVNHKNTSHNGGYAGNDEHDNHFRNITHDHVGASDHAYGDDGDSHDVSKRYLEGRLVESIRRRLKHYIAERLLDSFGVDGSHSLESASQTRGSADNLTAQAAGNATDPTSVSQSNQNVQKRLADLDVADLSELAVMTQITMEDPELMDSVILDMLELDDVLFGVMEEVFSMDVKQMVDLLPGGGFVAPAFVQKAIQDIRTEES